VVFQLRGPTMFYLTKFHIKKFYTGPWDCFEMDETCKMHSGRYKILARKSEEKSPLERFKYRW
jgi:hypothetical protein